MKTLDDAQNANLLRAFHAVLLMSRLDHAAVGRHPRRPVVQLPTFLPRMLLLIDGFHAAGIHEDLEGDGPVTIGLFAVLGHVDAAAEHVVVVLADAEAVLEYGEGGGRVVSRVIHDEHLLREARSSFAGPNGALAERQAVVIVEQHLEARLEFRRCALKMRSWPSSRRHL